MNAHNHYEFPIDPDSAAGVDTLAVVQFASAMASKLHRAATVGRAGWNDPARCSDESLQRLLHASVATGDPIDVGNYAMMLHARGASTALACTHPTDIPQDAIEAAAWNYVDPQRKLTREAPENIGATALQRTHYSNEMKAAIARRAGSGELQAPGTDACNLTNREIMEEWDRHYIPAKKDGTAFLEIVVKFARHWMALKPATGAGGQHD